MNRLKEASHQMVRNPGQSQSLILKYYCTNINPQIIITRVIVESRRKAHENLPIGKSLLYKRGEVTELILTLIVFEEIFSSKS